jgi:AcrR family transcriptional regulator
MSTSAAPAAEAPGDGRLGRRHHFSESTRRALVEVATRLFAEHGYAATSLDAIVAGAEVTKGALYHHFSGKQALFEAVFLEVESSASDRIQRAVRGHEDPWEQAVAGFETLVEVVRQPAYRRVVVHEGPAVLGYERFREQEELSAFAHVREIVRGVLTAGAGQPEEAMVETFTRIFFGAMSAAGAPVSSSEDPDAAAERVAVAMGLILVGLREVIDSGAPLAQRPTLPQAPTSRPTSSRPDLR